MSAKLRSKLTYSNVVSTFCLFLILGGGAYAATKLPKNSVGTKQLKNGSVTGKKVAANTLTGANINVSTLGSVPNATHAANADNAAHATSADNATTASKAISLGGIGPSGFVPASKFFSSGLVQLNPEETTTEAVLITDGPLSLVGVCSVDGVGYAVGDVLIATTEDNTTWSNGNNGNFTIGPSTEASKRTILEVGPAMSQGYVAGKSFGAVTASGTTLNGLVSAGLYVQTAEEPCLFHVDAFG